MGFYFRMKEKLGRFAIRNLPLYASIAFAVGFVMMMTEAGSAFYFRYLAFFPYEVLHGQIWRILTAVIYPPFGNSSLVFGILGIFIYYNFAVPVERTMGSFAFNLYFFGSILIGELGSIVFYLFSSANLPFIPLYTHFSVMMAFAVLYPQGSILLYGVIPLKAWLVAAAELVIFLWRFFVGDLYTRISVLTAMVPVLLFYLIVRRLRHGEGIIGRLRFRMQQSRRQAEWRNKWK